MGEVCKARKNSRIDFLLHALQHFLSRFVPRSDLSEVGLCTCLHVIYLSRLAKGEITPVCFSDKENKARRLRLQIIKVSKECTKTRVLLIAIVSWYSCKSTGTPY